MSARPTLLEVFECQLELQQCVDDKRFDELARIRDTWLRQLATRERLQLKLACGILERLVDR